jgi:hypothetical protein
MKNITKRVKAMSSQSNPNIDDKRLVEVYDWKDSQWHYASWWKKHNRKLRRKKLDRKIKRNIQKEVK